LLEADAAGVHPVLRQDLTALAGYLLEEEPSTPSDFDRYTILGFLGQGGMGSVYLAQRVDLGDLVAIKFLREDWSSPERRDRFAAEQRTLANLSYRHIAKLYDAGVENGTPWFAMEYVKGTPVTTYCQTNQLGLNERLRLFRAVCEAVAYAHRSLIVHLDLKPSNILVNESGEVKLLDFGISKTLDPDGRETEKTQTGLRRFSLNYGSPEQIRGELLDVQTDVYGLGVVLYELLTGRIPADLSRASTAELARYIETDVQRPSEVAKTQGAGSIRASKIDWNDLDVLCLTALHRDRSRRYRVVDGLIRDLDHFLNREPLEARTDTFSYRLSKFARRNRRELFATIAVILLLSASSVWFTVRLISARNQAVSSEAHTQRIQQLMLNLFNGDDNAAGPAKGLRVVDLLDRGVQQANSLQNDTQLQAQLRYTLGRLYEKLGRPDRAEPLLRTALNEQLRHFGLDNSEAVKTQLALANLLKEQSKFGEAEHLARDVVNHQQQKYWKDSVAVGTARATLGSILSAKGHYADALPLLEEARTLLSADPPSPALSETLSDLATTHYERGDIDDSEQILQRALALDHSLFGSFHPNVATDLTLLANIDMDHAQYRAAEEKFRQAVDIDRSWYGEDHQHTGESLSGLASALLEQKKYQDADSTFDRALNAVRASDGERSVRAGEILSLKGDSARLQRNFDAAARCYEEAANILRSTLGEEHENYAAQLSALGSIRVLKHEYVLAEKVLRTALTILQSAVPAERFTGLTEVRLAAALAGQKRFPEAEAQALTGYETLKKKTAAGSVEVKSARKELYDIYTAWGQPNRAILFR
jgi:serine/threonine-protein kinase